MSRSRHAMRFFSSFVSHSLAAVLGLAGCLSAPSVRAQVTTTGFANTARPEAPGTLLSHPVANDSANIGRTTSLNYLNGWLMVGAEIPGSRADSDLIFRVYDISNPSAPVRRYPSDFGYTYPGNRWYQGNYGWGAHGSAQSNDLVLPEPLRVPFFGGPVQLGGDAAGHGIPDLAHLPLGYTRSSQAGPWDASQPWYGTPDGTFYLSQPYLDGNGFVNFRPLAAFDHVGPFGGGDWHPTIFGDLLIYARSGGSGRDGVVVYRLEYHNFDAPDRSTRSVTPHFVGSLSDGFQGYWPTLFSDGSGLYVIGSTTNILLAADITAATHPSGDGSINLVANLTVPGFTNASYPTFQDNFGFIHNRKVDMTRFLAGDASPIVLTLDEAATGVNTSQMSLPLGNLWITGGYPIPGTSQGMGVWVHQQAPDTTRPRISYHIPQAGRSGYPRHAPLSFLLHEHGRSGSPRVGTDFLVRPVLPGGGLGASVTGFIIHDFSGVLTFTPDTSLAADTTYQVDFVANDGGTPGNLADDSGWHDAAGNLIEPYSFRFSTGSALDAAPPPVFTALSSDRYQPAPGESFTVNATAALGAPTAGPLSYRFNFDGTWSAWSASPSASHAYASAGRPRVLAQIRDAAGALVTRSLNLLVLPATPDGPRPTQSSTLAVGDDPAGRRVWVVNPDSDSVAVLDAATGEKLSEYSTGPGSSPRSIARDALGRYWVTCHHSDEVRVLQPDGATAHSLTLPYGSAPFGVAASPDGQSLFVTLYGSGRLLRYAAANPGAAPAAVDTGFPTPRALAVSADGDRVLVTRFISPELEAEIGDFTFSATPTPTLTRTQLITLASAITIDGGDRAAGVPNQLAAIAISPDGTRAAIASQQANTRRGLLFGVRDLTHETTVRSVVSFFDLVNNVELADTRRDLDNSDSPSALVFTPRGDTLLVAQQGNNQLSGLDMLGLGPVAGYNTTGATLSSPAVISLELGTGLAPQGLLIDPVANRLFVQNFMGRSVTVRDAAPLLLENRSTLPELPASPVSTVATELLAPSVLTGKRIFYNAADSRMSADGYISCATCHLDGGTDGRVWDFTGRGEGLRRTTDLRGRSGLGHGRVHWSGNFDEIQDFEHDIRGPFGGTGFLALSPTEFAALHPSPATGKTGLSPELDALAAYVSSLTPASTPRSPQRHADGSLSAAALRGRTVFTAQACATCHTTTDNRLTDSALGSVSAPNLHDVGTLSALSGLRLRGPLEGIDTPTLHGLHANRSYLHHGEAPTLADVFSYAGGSLRLVAQSSEFTPGYAVAAPTIELINPAGIGLYLDAPAEGGGGFLRGAIGGSAGGLGNATPTPGVRFTAIDGGLAGGPARIALRYLRQYNGGTALLRVNGVQQTLAVEIQTPENSWMASGWRWVVAEAVLQPGPANTIEVLRGDGDLQVNALLVANADDLAAAQPHRRVLALASGDQADLLAYLRSLDGRDDAGAPLAAPTPPGASAPGIVVPPLAQTLAVGNPLNLLVAVSGTGPFAYQWFRGATPIGGNSPVLEIPSVTPTDAGLYNVRITNIAGEVASAPVQITVNPALSVATAELPRATVGRAYAVDLNAAGGVGTRVWSLASGLLPNGLALSADGRIHGTATAPARAVLTARVTDATGTATRQLALDVRPVGGFSADPDLILHYTFDEGTGTRVWDSALAGNNHATDIPNAPAGFPLNAPVSWSPNGRYGGAYGSTDLTQGIAPFFPANQSDLDFDPRAQAFTLSVWVRTTTTEGFRTILSKNGFEDENWNVQYRLWTTSNPVSNVQGIAGNGWSGPLATAPALNNGQWHLLTLVNYLDGATWRTRLYHNGGTTFTEWNTGPGGRVSRLLAIGDTSNGWNSWNGQLDDLRIYRRALSPAEITALYTAPATPVDTYDTWLAGLSSALPIDQVAPTADPDGDGVPNLLEYALATLPDSAASRSNLAAHLSDLRLQLTFTRHRADLDYVVEASGDLVTWTAIATNPGTLGAEVTVQDTALLTVSPRRFLRLRVSER